MAAQFEHNIVPPMTYVENAKFPSAIRDRTFAAAVGTSDVLMPQEKPLAFII